MTSPPSIASPDRFTTSPVSPIQPMALSAPPRTPRPLSMASVTSLSARLVLVQVERLLEGLAGVVADDERDGRGRARAWRRRTRGPVVGPRVVAGLGAGRLHDDRVTLDPQPEGGPGRDELAYASVAAAGTPKTERARRPPGRADCASRGRAERDVDEADVVAGRRRRGPGLGVRVRGEAAVPVRVDGRLDRVDVAGDRDLAVDDREGGLRPVIQPRRASESSRRRSRWSWSRRSA